LRAYSVVKEPARRFVLVTLRTRQRAFNYGSVVRDCASKRARQPGWRSKIVEKISGFS
jgi:hypothetical protein